MEEKKRLCLDCKIELIKLSDNFKFCNKCFVKNLKEKRRIEREREGKMNEKELEEKELEEKKNSKVKKNKQAYHPCETCKLPCKKEYPICYKCLKINLSVIKPVYLFK